MLRLLNFYEFWVFLPEVSSGSNHLELRVWMEEMWCTGFSMAPLYLWLGGGVDIWGICEPVKNRRGKRSLKQHNKTEGWKHVQLLLLNVCLRRERAGRRVYIYEWQSYAELYDLLHFTQLQNSWQRLSNFNVYDVSQTEDEASTVMLEEVEG